MGPGRNRTSYVVIPGIFCVIAYFVFSDPTPPQRGRACIVIANGADPKSLDPAQVSGAVEGRILRALYEGLTSPHPVTLEPQPGMAQRWEIDADGRRYRFHIRDDALWSNGDPVTASDFVWSWRRLLDPNTAGQYVDLLWPVVGAREFNAAEGPWESVAIRATTPHTLEVELRHPVPYFLSLVGFFPLFPVHRPSVEAAEVAGVSFTRPERLIGNGPFLLAERRLRDRIRLVKNNAYWDAANVRINVLDVLAVQSPNTQLNLFLSGAVDWVSEIPRPVVPILKSDPRYADVYRPAPYLATYFYRVNTTRPPFDDRRVRQALSLSIDRAEIVERVTRAGEEVAWSLVPWPREAIEHHHSQHGGAESSPMPVPFEWYERALCAGAEASRPWRSRGFDPARGRALLAEMGYRVPRADADGGAVELTAGREFPVVEILYNSSPLHERVAEVIQSQWWRHLGIQVSLTNQEWGSYLSAQQSLTYDVSRSMWIGDYLDPNTFLEVFLSGGPNNRTGWQSPEYDALLDEARACADAPRRARLLHDAERILMEELPVIPIYYHVTEGMVAADTKHLGGNALNTLLPKHFVKERRP